jgi:4-hydroxy-2-oxoheptanedioate aldolase
VATQGTKEYFETCNRETLLIPQCETMGCLENIEEIAAIEGVDGIFIGPYDLSVALGKPTQFEDPEFLAAVGRIVSACRSARKLTFIYAGSLEKAKDYWRAGFDAVAYSNDAAEAIKALRNAAAYIKG